MEYFTKIQEPKKLRISMMTAARDSVIIISMLESFTEIRKQKSELVISLKDDFKEMNNLCKQLSEFIADEKTRREALETVRIQAKEETLKPQSKTIKNSKIGVQKTELPKIQTEEEVMPRFTPKQKTEADRLEYTLAQIEQKLADLQK